MKERSHTGRHNFFDLYVEMPDAKEFCFSHGKISLEFKQPVVHFGFPSTIYVSSLPAIEQRRYALREAVRSFMSMIEKELLTAADELLKEDKEQPK